MTTKAAYRFPASPSPPGGRNGRGSPASTPTANRSPSKAPDCSPGCCNPKPGTWTDSCTWTSSSAGTPAPQNEPSNPRAGAYPGSRGRRVTDRIRSVTDGLVPGPRSPGDGSQPAPPRIGPAADGCGRTPVGGGSGGAGADEDG